MDLRIVRAEQKGVKLLPGLARTVAKGFADNIQRLKHDETELLLSLSNSLRLHDQAVQHALSPLGRLIGLFTSHPDPDHIRIDGMRLKQLLELTGTSTPTEIIIGEVYEIDLLSVRHLLSVAAQRSAERPRDQESKASLRYKIGVE